MRRGIYYSRDTTHDRTVNSRTVAPWVVVDEHGVTLVYLALCGTDGGDTAVRASIPATGLVACRGLDAELRRRILAVTSPA